MAKHIKSLDELRALVVAELGVTEWTKVTQAQVDKFADATGDHQWIHTDPQRAASGPFGGTVAHFPAPVPVGSNVRAAVGIASAQQKPSGIEVLFNVRFESDAATKPVCVAESLILYR